MSDPWLEMLPRQLEKTTFGDFLETGAVFALIDGNQLFDLVDTDSYNYRQIINSAMSSRKPYDTVRLANVMQSLGWTKCRKGGRRGYLKP